MGHFAVETYSKPEIQTPKNRRSFRTSKLEFLSLFRFSNHEFFVLRFSVLLAAAVMIGTVGGCKKKDRNSNADLVFRINPGAAKVVKGDSVTLRAEGVSPSGTVTLNPTWDVSSSAGTLSTTIGPTVSLTAQSLGDVVVTATYQDLIATSQIAIVTFIPTSNTFDIYTDAGLPSGSDVDIFVSGNVSGKISELSTGYTPEGIRYQRTAAVTAPGAWGVTFDFVPSGDSKNLSAFSGGSLKFSIRLVNRTVGAGEVINVNIEDTGGAGTPVNLVGGGGGFNRLSQNWQEISISLASFGGGIDFSTIKVPFSVELATVPTDLTFDIDAVRWEK